MSTATKVAGQPQSKRLSLSFYERHLRFESLFGPPGSTLSLVAMQVGMDVGSRLPKQLCLGIAGSDH